MCTGQSRRRISKSLDACSQRRALRSNLYYEVHSPHVTALTLLVISRVRRLALGQHDAVRSGPSLLNCKAVQRQLEEAIASPEGPPHFRDSRTDLLYEQPSIFTLWTASVIAHTVLYEESEVQVGVTDKPRSPLHGAWCLFVT